MTGEELIKSLRAVMRYHLSCGISGYRGKEVLEASFGALEQLLVADRSDAPVSVSSADCPVSPASLAEIVAEVAVCRNCELHRNRVIAVPGSGSPEPVLLIVGEWLAVPAGGDVPIEPVVQFGDDEDRMLERMTAAIGLTSADVFVTNVVKCAVLNEFRPTLAHASVCASYLKQQIEILAPTVICAMGTMACQILTGVARPLSTLRGKMFMYRLASGRQLPVMPTYHPTFLLQNPEMKRAVWSDLQTLAKTLREYSP